MRERFYQIGAVVVVCFGLMAVGWVVRGAYDRAQWAAREQREAAVTRDSRDRPPIQVNAAEPIDPKNPPPTALVASNRPLHPNQPRPKYHKLTCAHVRNMKVEYRVYFRTSADAEAAGLGPCLACKPNIPTSQPEEE